MLAAAKLVMLLLWWGAATSKLNRHFPFVVAIMISNSPLAVEGLRRQALPRFPDDLRPSRLGRALAHGGTASSSACRSSAPLADGGPSPRSRRRDGPVPPAHPVDVPMGVPLEWNIFMIFAILILFGAHGDIGPAQVHSPWLSRSCWPSSRWSSFGNLFPDKVSFLLAMRYYAGNWATRVVLPGRRGVQTGHRDPEGRRRPYATQLAAMYGPERCRSGHEPGQRVAGHAPSRPGAVRAARPGRGRPRRLRGHGGRDRGRRRPRLELRRRTPAQRAAVGRGAGALPVRAGRATGDRAGVAAAPPRSSQQYRIVDAATGVVETGT